MPRRSRTDRLVLIMGLVALGAGVFVALTIAAVSGQKVRNVPDSVVAGNAGQLRQAVADKGALYLTGGRKGFWLVWNGTTFEALVPEAPAPARCTVDFDTATRVFVCKGTTTPVDPATLPRYPVTVDANQRVKVNLRESTPPPGPGPTTSGVSTTTTS